jgi:hypothetical protein
VGNIVITPKPGESFSNTMQRAAAYGKTVTPTQVNAELATAPAKAAQVVMAAPAIGALGAAGLSVGDALPSVLAHTTEGVRAIGTWANANPVQAYLVYNLLRELVPGAKKAMGLVQHAPVE